MPDRLSPSLFDDALPEPSAVVGSGDGGGDAGGTGGASRRAAFPRAAKAPDALRTIGEVAGALGIRQHVLRYWEEQFPMLRPLKRSGGRRYYRPADVALVERIDQLVNGDGFTLRGARLVLQGKGAEGEPGGGAQGGPVPPGEPARAVCTEAPAAGTNMAQALRALRARLAAALD